MSIGFFSVKEKTNDSKFKSQVELTELKGTFIDRVIERLNKTCDESRQEFEQRLQLGKTKELKKEIVLKDLITKDHFCKKILELELKVTKQIHIAKWQVIGSMFVFFIAGVVAKYFGF